MVLYKTRTDLEHIACEAMRERGLESEFSAAVLRQLATIASAGSDNSTLVQDRTHLPWCSIDNEDSMDLDQLTACEVLDAAYSSRAVI
jgi:exoribonuclease-2